MSPQDGSGRAQSERHEPGPAEGKSGLLSTFVRVEKVIQLVLLFPAAMFIGWAVGAALDHWLKQHWIYIPGLLLGSAAGFVQIFRTIGKLNEE